MTLDPDSGSPHLDPLEEARALIDALFEDRLSADGAARLERLVIERKDVRRLYLRYMHLTCSLPPIVAPHDMILSLGYGDDEESDGDGDQGDAALSSAVVMRAIRETDVPPGDEDVEPAFAPVVAPRPTLPRRELFPTFTRHTRLVTTIGGLLAACVVLALVLLQPDPRAPRSWPPLNTRLNVAYLTGTAAAEWEGDPAPPGTGLQPGQLLLLRRGAAELSLASGTQVVIEGPAAFRVIDRNRLKLDHGKLVAQVPAPARGFTVDSPTLSVTDQGTEFGMHLVPSGTALVDVFNGAVDLNDPGAPGTPPGNAGSAPPPPATRLTAGQAVSCAAAGAALKPVTTNPGGFARDLTQVRLPLPLRGTGAGLKPGNADPNWSVVAKSRDPDWKPAPATVVAPKLTGPVYDLSQSQWVAAAAEPGTLASPKHDPLDGTITYRAQFDLTGFDPATVSIRLFVSADDGVADVLLNGRTTGIKVSVLDKSFETGFREFTLRDAFQPGVNVVDVVVQNAARPMDGPENRNATWLRLAWDGTAVPIVTR